MDDPDDYFVDDITLDDNTLALLVQEEQKYLNSQNNALLDAPSVSKKRKTDSGWRPGPGSHTDNADDDEYLPEISVQGDGTYEVRDVVRTSIVKNPLNTINTDKSLSSTTRVTEVTTQSGPTFSAGLLNIEQQHSADSTKTENMSTMPFQRASPNSKQHGHAEQQLRELQKRLQELSEENQTMKSALKEAKDLKLTKEGEVTILRKGMEKAAQEHTTQIARLKAEKEGADAKQLQVQKETKEEIERMRTQIIFKQQEIESTLRRVPSSARANRINRDPLRTPARRSSQAIGDTPGPNRLKLEQSQPLEEQHIETPKSRRFRSPKNASYSGILPGFQNAFSASPIARLRVDVAGQESPPSCSSTRLSPPSSPTARLVRNQGINAHTDLYQHNSHAIIDNDSETMVMDEEENNQEVETMGQPISWTSELSRIILTHALPNSTRPTLQLLLATSALAVEANAFQFATACSEIFEVIAGPSGTMDYTITVRKLCDPLVTMLFVVGCSEQNYTIQSLINLLTALVLSLPDFGSHLLQASDNMQSSFSAAIREIIIHHLGPAKKSDALANETLGLLEALCLRNRNNIISRLAPLVESGKVWAALLQDGQNEGTLVRTCQLLVLLGSHPPLSRELVHVSGVSSKDRDELVEPGRLFLVDRLCTFLYEENHKFNELHTIREHILTLFATLSLSDPDSLTALTNNDVLIPSLVCLLSNLTNLLWEEDERLMTAPQPVAALIHMTNQVVTLIHHLVVSMESSFNLKPRVHHNSHQALTGLNHIFIVSFGRLSYADPPDWIDKPGRRELESLTDIARELLDIVVDGPESDYIWSLYQEDPDKNESEADEGEIEARLLGD